MQRVVKQNDGRHQWKSELCQHHCERGDSLASIEASDWSITRHPGFWLDAGWLDGKVIIWHDTWYKWTNLTQSEHHHNSQQLSTKHTTLRETDLILNETRNVSPLNITEKRSIVLKVDFFKEESFEAIECCVDQQGPILYPGRHSISEVVSSDQENIEVVTNVGRASSCPVMAVLSLGHRGF